jgi:hypothetical protein
VLTLPPNAAAAANPLSPAAFTSHSPVTLKETQKSL